MSQETIKRRVIMMTEETGNTEERKQFTDDIGHVAESHRAAMELRRELASNQLIAE